MSNCKLSNLLKTYRKRSYLTQKELAFLFGHESGSKISRYEHSLRVPKLESLLYYSSIFGVPISELFSERFNEANGTTKKRSQLLLYKLVTRPPCPANTRKIRFLQELCGLISEK